MNERLQRLTDDARFLRIWNLGSVAYDASRELRIQAKLAVSDAVHRALTPHLEPARAVYDQFVAPSEPLMSMTGYLPSGPFSVSLNDLRAVWREQRRSA